MRLIVYGDFNRPYSYLASHRMDALLRLGRALRGVRPPLPGRAPRRPRACRGPPAPARLGHAGDLDAAHRHEARRHQRGRGAGRPASGLTRRVGRTGRDGAQMLGPRQLGHLPAGCSTSATSRVVTSTTPPAGAHSLRAQAGTAHVGLARSIESTDVSMNSWTWVGPGTVTGSPRASSICAAASDRWCRQRRST
jgi:hypothetical protein